MNRPEGERPAWDGGPAEALSAAGAARREGMMVALLPAVRARRRRRMAARGVAVVAPVVLVAATAWVTSGGRGAGAGGKSVDGPRITILADPRPVRPMPDVEAGPRVAVVVVRTDVGVLERVRMRGGAEVVERIGDGELNALLAEAGLRPGIIRTSGRVMLAAELQAREDDRAPAGPSGALPGDGELEGVERRLTLAAAYSVRQ